MVYPFFFFTMKEGALNAEYRVANRFGNKGCVNEKICKFSPEKKDEGFPSYFEMGTMVMIYSYLRGDLRKEVLDYTYSHNNYKKEVAKQMDTWLDAVRNLRNYCAHHSMVVGMTSSVVIPNNRDSADVLPDNTNLYSRLYALKKILPQEDANMLATELERLISRAKIDVYKMNILPADWKNLYDRILFL